MYFKKNGITGHFKKYLCSFASYDDGQKLVVQIIKTHKNYTFRKFKDNIRKNPFITVQTSFKSSSYDYHIYDIRSLGDEFELYYDYRIEHYSDRKCFSIDFYSKDIDVFGQNRAFLDSFMAGIKNCNFELEKTNYNRDLIILNKKYKFSLINSILTPMHMKHNVSFCSLIRISSEEEISIENIIKIYEWMLVFLQFCSFRKNVKFDYIDLLDNCQPELSDYELPFGELYVPYNSIDHEFKNYSNNPMIKVDSIIDVISPLFDFISQKKISGIYIPNDTDSFNSNFVNATSWLQNFFRIWALSNNQFVVKNINVEDTMSKTKKGQNSVVTFAKMIDFLFDYSRNYFLDAYDEAIGFFKFFNNMQEYQASFSTRIKEMRNDLCHGHVDYNSNYYRYARLDLKILNMVIYASILKYIGISKENCNKALNQLFNNKDLN